MTEAHAPEQTHTPSLAELVAYVISAGWRRVPSDRADIWFPSGHSAQQLHIALPSEPAASDVGSQIDDAVRVVAYVEGRTPSETVASIVNGGADTLSLRLLPDLPSGTASLKTAEKAISALRSLIVGSAAGLDNQDLVLPSRRPTQVESYAGQAHVSSRPGSFILDVVLPLNADADEIKVPPGQGTLVEMLPPPYGRRVTERIRQVSVNALAKAQQVVEGRAGIHDFGQANLGLGNALELEALAQMGGDLAKPYDLRLTQSALARRSNPTTMLNVSSAQCERLAEAAEYLRTSQTQHGAVVEGFVIRLSKDTPSLRSGDITVRAVLDDSGRPKTCVMNLPAEDYAEAWRAHKDGLWVAARGDLVASASGRRRRLKNVSGFEVRDQI